MVPNSTLHVCVSPATAIVKVNLPRGVSDTEIITPNYPKDFPDDEQILWEFSIPGMHNYSVQFSEHSAPECLDEGEVVVVEYQKEGMKPTRTALTDPQPQHQQGGFNLTLKNCKTNQTLPGLSLRYTVSVIRSGHPGEIWEQSDLDHHVWSSLKSDACFLFSSSSLYGGFNQTGRVCAD